MNALRTALLATLVAVLFPWKCAASPVVLGLANKHPLTEHEIGELLISELGCVSCHIRRTAIPSLARAAPDISDVGSRVSPDFLRRFVASPSAAHSGTTMPDLLTGETGDQRTAIAEAITHFLVAQSPRKYQHDTIAENDAAVGKSLFHSVGCVACHAPRDETGKEVIRDGVVELTHVSGKYSSSSLTDFLVHPARVRPAGRMPDMKLTPVEAKAIAGYLLVKVDTATKPLQPRQELVALGKTYFQQFNCAACHKLDNIPATPPARDLQAANLERGCLSKTPGKSPRFHLGDDQSKAIRLAIKKGPAPISDKTLLATTLTAFNCIACHVRDDFGGVSQERNLHFQSDAKNLGDDARIPPPLTLAGARLQPLWLKKVLFDAESVRPYMFTRMPQFGEPNIRHLPDLFTRLDRVEEVKFSLPNSESANKKERARAQELRDAGRKLLGNQSLNCVACHNFNGKTPQNNGIELMTSYQRLQPSWFYHFLCNPNAYRPRIVMPAAWPGGKAVDTSVLDGSTDRQIEAIWYFLSLGRSAPDPAGVQPLETKLLVADAARVYRGRSSVAGYRGIAVGFPEKLNYAFNAETGTLSAIWRGDFVRVDRSGQGSGGFQPAGKHVALTQDVSFFVLASEQSPWPLRPVMTKEQRVNPDPLYPKNHGYQFKGYYLDAVSIPSFMYRSGDLDIEDRAAAGDGDKRLVRDFKFNAPAAQSIWFRALTGTIEIVSKHQYKNREIQLTVPPIQQILLRPTAADPSVSELLLKLDIPQGKSNLSLTYDLLK